MATKFSHKKIEEPQGGTFESKIDDNTIRKTEEMNQFIDKQTQRLADYKIMLDEETAAKQKAIAKEING